MKKLQILQAISDDNFMARAYADYMESCTSEYTTLLNATTSIVTGEKPDSQSVNDYVLQSLSDMDIPATAIIEVPNGYIQVKDLCVQAYQQIESWSDPMDSDHTDINDVVLSLQTATGQISQCSTTILDVFNNIRANLHSATVAVAAIRAAAEEAINDRLTSFNERITETFQNAYDDISGALIYFRTLLKDKALSAVDLVQIFTRDSDINTRDSEPDYVYSKADVYKYSNASPIAIVDWSIGKKLAEATVGAVFTGVKTIWNKITTGYARFKTAAASAVAKLAVPVDIGILDADSSAYTVDGWAISDSEVTSVHGYVGFPSTSLPADFDTWDFQSWLNSKYGEHWYKYDTIFGEVLHKINATGTVGINTIGANKFMTVATSANLQFKPKCLNHECVAKALSVAGCTVQDGINRTNTTATFNAQRSRWLTYNELLSAIEFLKECPDLYLDVDDSYYSQSGMMSNEWAVYRGFQLATWFFVLCVTYEDSFCQTADLDPDPDWYPEHGFSLTLQLSNTDASKTTPGNKDFLVALSGWDDDDQAFSFEYCVLPDFSYHPPRINQFFTSFLLAQGLDRYLSPGRWMFIPYRQDVEGFSASRFYLKTDAENQAALSKFATVVTYVTIAAITAATAIILLKEMKFRKQIKMNNYVQTATAKIWNGEPLTYMEQAKLMKYQSKLGLASVATLGLQGVTLDNNDATSGDILSNIKLIKSMITG